MSLRWIPAVAGMTKKKAAPAQSPPERNPAPAESITPPQPTEDRMGRNVTLSLGALIVIIIVVALLF
jgi:hypothetical protein